MKTSVKIVGAGISGLSLAYYLKERHPDCELQVYESSAYEGGLIQSFRDSGSLVETGANAFFRSKHFFELAEKLNLEILEPRKESKKRYIFHKGAPRRWPLTFFQSLELIKNVPFVKKKKPYEGETLYDWSLRALGEGVTQNLLAPALQGIYAASLKELNASLFYDSFFTKKKTKTALPSRMKASVAPKEGMASFLKALLEDLKKKQVPVHFSKKLTAQDIARWQEQGAKVYVCTNVHQAGVLLADVDPEQSKALLKVPVKALMTSTIFFEKKKDDLLGFGVLFPEYENFKNLGVLFNGSIFNHRENGVRSETWISSWDVEDTDEEVVQRIHEDRLRLGMNSKVVGQKITRWKQALPCFGAELYSWKKNFFKKSSPVTLHGNYTGKISLARILEDSQRIAYEGENLK